MIYICTTGRKRGGTKGNQNVREITMQSEFIRKIKLKILVFINGKVVCKAKCHKKDNFKWNV